MKSETVRNTIIIVTMLTSLVHADAEREKFLLLDERILESVKNARLTVGTVKKHYRNPLFAEDKPWEPRFDNLYANVLYDEDEDLYKCWYSPFIIDESTTNTPRKDRVNGGRFKYQGKHTGRRREMGICYAVSRDGVNWEKPSLGVVEFGGCDDKHFGWRNGYFCLATLRPDGFAGYEPVDSDQPGYIQTAPVVCRGEDLRICADIEKNGSVKTQLFDSNNKPLADGELVTKTVTDGSLQWKDEFSFSQLKGKDIKLRFELRESKLYSFRFASLERQKPSNDHGFISIFDGKTLDGWHAVPKECASDWSVHDGVIVGQGSADRLSYLAWKDDRLRDFELKLRYRLPGKGNTGVEIRSQPDPTGKRPFEGYHADLGHVGIGPHILGAWDFHFAKRKEYPCPRGTRLVIDEDGKPHSSPIHGALIPTDVRRHQWNDVRIIARGNHFQFFINGKLASEFTDKAKRGRLEQGALGLQIHDKGMRVEFKDIQLRQLAVTEDGKAFFSEQPLWSSGTAKSGGDGIARFIDFDRDGDLDLAVGCRDQAHIYENLAANGSRKPKSY